jgi:hypothetical protein
MNVQDILGQIGQKVQQGWQGLTSVFNRPTPPPITPPQNIPGPQTGPLSGPINAWNQGVGNVGNLLQQDVNQPLKNFINNQVAPIGQNAVKQINQVPVAGPLLTTLLNLNPSTPKPGLTPDQQQQEALNSLTQNVALGGTGPLRALGEEAAPGAKAAAETLINQIQSGAKKLFPSDLRNLPESELPQFGQDPLNPNRQIRMEPPEGFQVDPSNANILLRTGPGIPTGTQTRDELGRYGPMSNGPASMGLAAAKTPTDTSPSLISTLLQGAKSLVTPDPKLLKEQIDSLPPDLGGGGVVTTAETLASKVPQAASDFQRFLESSGVTKPEDIDRILATKTSAAREAPVLAQPSEAAHTTQEMLASEELGQKGSILNPLKALPAADQSAFQDFVNHRQAADLVGQTAAQPFKSSLTGGINDIFKYQAGDRTGKLSDVEQLFNSLYQKEQASGITYGSKADYLPQLWKEPESVVEQKLGRTLSQRPSFTLESVIKDYKEGIDKGLTPKFKDISDLVRYRVGASEKALANKQYFDYLVSNGKILPGGKAPKGWVTLDPDHFPTFKSRFAEGGQYSGVYKSPPQLARVLNNYLGNEAPGLLQKISNFASGTKNLVITAGIPKTGVNIHGFNILARATLAAKNPATALARVTGRLLHPGAAAKELASNMERATFWAQHGMTLTTEEHSLDDLPKNIVTKGQEVLFHDPLFRKIIPAEKIRYAEEILPTLSKSLPKDEAARLASQQANNVFGGINWQAMGRSKSTQALMRSLIFAPDFQEGGARLGGGLLKGATTHLTDPKYAAYRTFARNLLGAYVAANVANYKMSGHLMVQNPAGHEFDLDTGTYTSDGQKRYVRPFGTSLDFLRIPGEAAAAVAKGDPGALATLIRNRTSTLGGSAVSLIANKDPFGNPIYGNDKQGNPLSTGQSISGVIGATAGIAMPQPVSALLSAVGGRQTGEQALSQSLGLPIRYTNTAQSPATKAMVAQMQSQGASGQQINQALQTRTSFATTISTELNNATPDVRKAYEAYHASDLTTDPNDPRNRETKAAIAMKNPEVLQIDAKASLAAVGGDMSKISPFDQLVLSGATVKQNGQDIPAYQVYETYLHEDPNNEEKTRLKENYPWITSLGAQEAQFVKSNPTVSAPGKATVPYEAPQPNAGVQAKLTYIDQLKGTPGAVTAFLQDPKNADVAQYLANQQGYSNYQRSLIPGLGTVGQFGIFNSPVTGAPQPSSAEKALQQTIAQHHASSVRRSLSRIGKGFGKEARYKGKQLMKEASHNRSSKSVKNLLSAASGFPRI